MSPREPTTGWLIGPRFDLGLILGVLVFALALCGLGTLGPALFAWVLLLDVWLLAYPHVASTYTRIAFDRASARRHWFLILALPPIMFAVTAGTFALGGLIALNTLYFTWQTWHYTRQSYGIARAYHRSAGAPAVRDLASDVVVFAFPLWGFLHRLHQRPGEFFGMALWTPEVPRAAVILAGAVALGALAAWIWPMLRPGPRARSAGLTLFVLTHVVITLVSYIVVPDITAGWLFINIWHNAQYLLFVWAMNARRFSGGVDPARGFLSRMCQRDRWLRYAAICLGLSTAFFFTFERLTAQVTWAVLPFALVCYQAFNFNHYVIDAVIWRSRRAPA